MPRKTSRKEASGSTVKSAARALDVFELLALERRGLSLSEMSRRLSIPISSLHGLVRTLRLREYLIRDDKTLTYRLGPKLLLFTQAYLDGVELIECASPVMERMHFLCGESVSLAVREGQDVVFISKRTSPKLVRIVNPVGTRLPLHATALGKCMLAFIPGAELDEVYPDEHLERLTPHTIATKSELKRQLADIGRECRAFDREESALGVWAVGAAIRDQFGSPQAATSIAVPSPRVTPELEARLARLVMVGASMICRELGHVTDDLPGPRGLEALDVAWMED